MRTPRAEHAMRPNIYAKVTDWTAQNYLPAVRFFLDSTGISLEAKQMTDSSALAGLAVVIASAAIFVMFLPSGRFGSQGTLSDSGQSALMMFLVAMLVAGAALIAFGYPSGIPISP
jgi:hypothetical protein